MKNIVESMALTGRAESHIKEAVVMMANITDRAESPGDAVARSLSALEALYRRHVARVYTLSLRLLADKQAAEEATVRVFARLSRELTGYLDETLALARLRQLSIDEAISRLGVRESTSAAAVPGVRASRTRTEKSEHQPVLTRATLDALVAGLPDPQRVAFVLHDQEGLGASVIAGHLRNSEAEVRRLVHAARLELRRRLRLTPTQGDAR
jgi:RNA polymerase sigma-70 factor (ECF subfamily)